VKYFKENNKTKLIYLGIFISLFTCYQVKKNYFNTEEQKTDTLITKEDCHSVINELVGSGVDSIKACDCLVPKINEMAASDTALISSFKNHHDFGDASLPFQMQYSQLLISCIRSSIADTNALLIFTPKLRSKLKERLEANMNKNPELIEKLDVSKFADCLVDKLNGNIRILDFFEMNSQVDALFEKFGSECLPSDERPFFK